MSQNRGLDRADATVVAMNDQCIRSIAVLAAQVVDLFSAGSDDTCGRRRDGFDVRSDGNIITATIKLLRTPTVVIYFIDRRNQADTMFIREMGNVEREIQWQPKMTNFAAQPVPGPGAIMDDSRAGQPEQLIDLC